MNSMMKDNFMVMAATAKPDCKIELKQIGKNNWVACVAFEHQKNVIGYEGETPKEVLDKITKTIAASYKGC